MLAIGARFLTVTYPHDWLFELIFWPSLLAVALFAWWLIGFNWPEL
jgi:hypothetical protein